MRAFLISAVALLMVGAAAPALALSKGDCYVELPLDTGAFVGLDSGKFEKTVRFADANGRNRTTKVTVNQKSADNSQRGAVTGKIAIVFPAGSICNFTNDSLNKKNAAYPDLVKALTGLTVGGYTNGSFGVTVAGFAGTSSTKKDNTTSSFAISTTLVDLGSTITLKPGGSKSFKPTITFKSGTASFLTTYSKTANKVPLSGAFGLPTTPIPVLATVAPIKKVSSCSLNLKLKDKTVPTFNLLCQNFKIDFTPYSFSDTKATIVLKQATGKGSVSLKGSVALTSAKRF